MMASFTTKIKAAEAEVFNTLALVRDDIIASFNDDAPPHLLARLDTLKFAIKHLVSEARFQ